MDFPEPTRIGHFKEVNVLAVYRWLVEPERPLVPRVADDPAPLVDALFSDDLCYCGRCTLLATDMRPCPAIEERAGIARQQFQELYPDFSVQTGWFTMPAYFTERWRAKEVVNRLIDLAPED
ncbi:hypothetical protein [Actinokineospora cianjurensis]|uniref:Uncharacterized protein n=1 Tax=Actinokineospora cianjurensis TaxID=585224 RepID=A0A421AYH9_9PSEU|nr:hypothetical protein [Actinokineospora cianjurensis]RLK54844.1 hypothetical protein CLV68_5233 [Actinokineospora cianjurensis]